MKVLVAYSSKMGGTRGIAETIRDALVERGFDADVVAVENARLIAGYSAAVIGGGLYAARWRRPARRFVKHNEAALRQMPVWFFSSGPLDNGASDREIAPTPRVRALMQRVGARGHATFGGRLAPDAKGFPASAMAKKRSGDWRDPQRIGEWAHEIADALVPASRLGSTHGGPAR